MPVDSIQRKNFMCRRHFTAGIDKMWINIVLLVTQVLGVSAANGKIRNRVSTWILFMGCVAMYGLDSVTV